MSGKRKKKEDEVEVEIDPQLEQAMEDSVAAEEAKNTGTMTAGAQQAVPPGRLRRQRKASAKNKYATRTKDSFFPAPNIRRRRP